MEKLREHLGWGKPRFGWVIALAVLAYVVIGTSLFNRAYGRNGASLHRLGFGYGVLLQALDEDGAYRVCDVHYPGLCFSAHRLPLIPYSLKMGGMLCGDDQGRVLWVKSIPLGGMLFLLLFLTAHRGTVPWTRWFAGTVLLLAMPRWAVVFFELSVEEAYLAVPLGLLFSMVLFLDRVWWSTIRAGIATGFILVTLLFLKNSMPFWAMAAPVLIWIIHRNGKAMAVSLILVLAGMAGLAAFNQIHSGKFTIGSSWAGWNLFKGNNPQTAELYPQYSLDVLDYEGAVAADRPLVDEWDHDRYFKERAKDFIRENKLEFAQLCLTKAWVFYADVRPNGASRDGSGERGAMKNLQQVWMVAFRLLLWWTIVRSMVDLWRWRSAPQLVGVAGFYLGFLFLYSGFHVVGFAYERHVVPIMFPTLLVWWWRSSARAKSVISSGSI